MLDIQELIGDTSWLIVNPSDMTQLALGLTQFPFDLGRQYGINSQIAHTFVPVIPRQYAQECADGNLQTLLGAICDPDNELHIPEHDTVSMSESAELGPAVVEDFYLDGFLRAQYRPAKTFALARQAFAGEYGEHELPGWMKAFYERFFGSPVPPPQLARRSAYRLGGTRPARRFHDADVCAEHAVDERSGRAAQRGDQVSTPPRA